MTVVVFPPPLQSAQEQTHDFPVPSFAEIPTGHRPGRGLILSIIVHELAFVFILVVGRWAVLHFSPSIAHAPAIDKDSVIYLPVVGGGSEGSGHAGGAAGASGKKTEGMRARSRRGFAYPGPQPVISNPPNSTPGIQTILQPSLINPPHLHRYIPLPDVVRPSAVASAPQKAETVIKVNQGRLALRETVLPTVDAPKLKLPVDKASVLSGITASQPDKPVLRPAAPQVADVRDVPLSQRDEKGLLVLNAVPPPPDVHGKLPAGESRSSFAVAPGEATVIAPPSAGGKGGNPSSPAGSGDRNDLAVGDSIAHAAGGGNGTGKAAGGSGTGTGSPYGTGEGTGLNATGTGTGSGRGNGAAAGIGSGSSGTSGSGSGPGSAPGGGSFPGITIQGGRYGNGGQGTVNATIERSPRSYKMNIESTASSGGGLPDVGIFQDEKVYTVYIDMRSNDEDPAPSWTLQYSVYRPSGIQIVGNAQSAPTPPYALLKEVPKFTPELLQKYGRQRILVSAIINTVGKLEQITVRQNAESALAAPIVQALSNWQFQPSETNGKPVALKVLLGIRMSPVPRASAPKIQN